MKYPYERFLRFLVSRKLDPSSTLARYGLPPVGGIWLAECRTSILDTAPPALAAYIDSDATALPSTEGVYEWADRECVGPLWAMQREFGSLIPPPSFDTAFRIFTNKYARAVMGCLLLSSATPAEIHTLIAERFDFDVDAAALATYKTVFWDISLVGRKQWERYVTTLTTPEERSYVGFGLTAPTAIEVRDMLGLQTTTDNESIVDNIVNKSYQAFERAMAEPQPEIAGAMRWAELALKAIGVKKGGAGKGGADPAATATDFRNMFSVKVTRSDHISLADLQGQVAAPKPAEKP